MVKRGANDIGESSEYILGDEEAMWVLKLILPYINEFLMKIRALFSGDPATTMKVKNKIKKSHIIFFKYFFEKNK